VPHFYWIETLDTKGIGIMKLTQVGGFYENFINGNLERYFSLFSKCTRNREKYFQLCYCFLYTSGLYLFDRTFIQGKKQQIEFTMDTFIF